MSEYYGDKEAQRYADHVYNEIKHSNRYGIAGEYLLPIHVHGMDEKVNCLNSFMNSEKIYMDEKFVMDVKAQDDEQMNNNGLIIISVVYAIRNAMNHQNRVKDFKYGQQAGELSAACKLIMGFPQLQPTKIIAEHILGFRSESRLVNGFSVMPEESIARSIEGCGYGHEFCQSTAETMVVNQEHWLSLIMIENELRLTTPISKTKTTRRL